MEHDVGTFKEIGLIDGERVDSALSPTKDLGSDHDWDSNVVLLTNRRVIQLRTDSHSRKIVFLSILDVDSIEITTNREWHRALLWGAVSLFVAVMLWRTWDHEVGSAMAAVTVAIMGAYLVADRLWSAGIVRTRFITGSSQILCDLRGDRVLRDVHVFVNRLFEHKKEIGKDDERSAIFAPR